MALFSLKDQINEVLEHFDYCLVTNKGNSSDNVIAIQYPVTPSAIKRYLIITYGVNRVSTHKGKIKVTS